MANILIVMCRTSCLFQNCPDLPELGTTTDRGGSKQHKPLQRDGGLHDAHHQDETGLRRVSDRCGAHRRHQLLFLRGLPPQTDKATIDRSIRKLRYLIRWVSEPNWSKIPIRRHW